eukprot:scaffold14939_cov20-Tisochrysis_lutea.AAC.2
MACSSKCKHMQAAQLAATMETLVSEDAYAHATLKHAHNIHTQQQKVLQSAGETTYLEPAVLQELLCRGAVSNVHDKHEGDHVLGGLRDYLPLAALKAVHSCRRHHEGVGGWPWLRVTPDPQGCHATSCE